MAMSLDEIKELVMFLRQSGVGKFQYQELSIEFPPAPVQKPEPEKKEELRPDSDVTDYGVIKPTSILKSPDIWGGPVRTHK
jgi:hypothetical protein